MKRIQITIGEELDAELDRRAAREGISKAALVRRYLAERLRPLPPLEEDPLWDIVGMIKDGDPDASLRVNEIVYDGR